MLSERRPPAHLVTSLLCCTMSARILGRSTEKVSMSLEKRAGVATIDHMMMTSDLKMTGDPETM